MEKNTHIVNDRAAKSASASNDLTLNSIHSWERLPVSCPVCATKDFEVIFTPKVQINDPIALYGAASGLPGTQQIVRCKSCRMIYENPRLPDEAILHGYANSNEAGHDSQYLMRVKSFLKALESLSAFLPGKDAAVLDVGTAGGAFLQAAKEYGYRPMGVEPSQYLTEHAKSRGLEVYCGTLQTAPFQKHSFDLVTLWDVLEHVTDPKIVLSQAKEMLKPGGIILINYPDIGSRLARLTGEKYWWLLSVHLHHFDKTSICEISKRCGLHVFHTRRYWQTLEFGYLEEVAIKLGLPIASALHKMTPSILRRLPLPYYAGQTTALVRVSN